MRAIVKRLFRDQRGATAVEYGLICALIVIASFTALRGFATENDALWERFSQKTQEAVEKAAG